MDVSYRVRQFRDLVTAHPLESNEWTEIERVLSPAEALLFRRYGVADRQHGFRVMETLRRAGNEDPDLLVAALLHDVGKTRFSIRLWERVAGALAELFAPSLVTRWGQGAPYGWRRLFVIRAQHAEWGAEMAATAGSSMRAIALIRYHQQKPPATGDDQLDTLLVRLQWADDKN